MALDVKNPIYDVSYLRVDLSCIRTLDSPPNELLLLRLPTCGGGETFERGSPSDFGSTLAFRTSFSYLSGFKIGVRLGLLGNPLDIVGTYCR